MEDTKSRFADKTLRCKDCRLTFTWSTGEQRFFRDKGFAPPKRCPECRAYLKRKMNAARPAEARR